MTNAANPNPRLDAALLEMACELRGTLISGRTADKITARILGKKLPDGADVSGDVSRGRQTA